MAYGDFGDDFGEQSNPGTSAAFGGDTSGGFGGEGFDAARGDYTGLVSNNQTKANSTNPGTKSVLDTSAEYPNAQNFGSRPTSRTSTIMDRSKQNTGAGTFNYRPSSSAGIISGIKQQAIDAYDSVFGKNRADTLASKYSPDDQLVEQELFSEYQNDKRLGNLPQNIAEDVASPFGKYATPSERVANAARNIAGAGLSLATGGLIPAREILNAAAVAGYAHTPAYPKSSPPMGTGEGAPNEPIKPTATKRTVPAITPNSTSLAISPASRKKSTMSAGNVYRRGNRGTFYV